MTRSAVALAPLGLFLLLMPASRVDACSCGQIGPACQSFWKTEAVFDATVEAIETTTREIAYEGISRPVLDREHVVKLSVRQAWKGVQAGPLEVVTNAQSSACGYEFKVGKRYLVFAWKRPYDGRWSVSACGLTQEYNGTGEAADFLASLSAPPRGGRVFGSVTINDRVFVPGRASQSRPAETRVRLVGGGIDRWTTSVDGAFEFRELPSGPYRLHLQVPAGYFAYAESRDVEIPNTHACAREQYYLSPGGVIAGRVVGPDGRPLARVKIETTDPDVRAHELYGIPTESDDTDADGIFEIRGLPPGNYVVGVNLSDQPSKCNPYARTLYPSEGLDPQLLTLSLGQTLDLGIWRLPPPLRAVHVSGFVIWQDGTPAAGVFVSAFDRTGNPTETARGAGGATAGSDGRFVIELREGRDYSFIARGRDNGLLPISAPRVDTAVALDSVTIVIRRDPPGRQ